MRDQLFAEALACLRSGETTYIDDKEVEDIANQQQKRRQASDPWVYSIQDYLIAQCYPDVNTKDVYKYAIQGNEASMTGVHQRRIAHCLKELNYQSITAWDPKSGEVKRVYRYFGKKAAYDDLLS
jgi:predicted P-loop ATPase